MDIAEFLVARLDEDEQAARAAARWHDSDWNVNGDERSDRWFLHSTDMGHPIALDVGDGDHGTSAAHIARHDPARVLADVAAKRALIWGITTDVVRLDAECEDVSGSNDDVAGMLLRDLAQPYADHPDFAPEWHVSSSGTSGDRSH